MPLKIPHTLSLLIVALRGLSGVSILMLSIKTPPIYCIYKIFSFLFLSFDLYKYVQLSFMSADGRYSQGCFKSIATESRNARNWGEVWTGVAGYDKGALAAPG